MRRFEWERWPNNLQFKPMGYSPVKGGRWSVRREPGHAKKPWRAWTRGQANRWGRRFSTHGEAVAWAHFVAEAYATHGRDFADLVIKAYAEQRRRNSRGAIQ